MAMNLYRASDEEIRELTPFVFCAYSIQGLRYALARGYPVNKTSPAGRDALFHLATTGYKRTARMRVVIEAGARTNRRYGGKTLTELLKTAIDKETDPRKKRNHQAALRYLESL